MPNIRECSLTPLQQAAKEMALAELKEDLWDLDGEDSPVDRYEVLEKHVITNYGRVPIVHPISIRYVGDLFPTESWSYSTDPRAVKFIVFMEDQKAENILRVEFDSERVRPVGRSSRHIPQGYAVSRFTGSASDRLESLLSSDKWAPVTSEDPMQVRSSNIEDYPNMVLIDRAIAAALVAVADDLIVNSHPQNPLDLVHHCLVAATESPAE